MTKLRITQHFYNEKCGFNIQEKSFFGWKTIKSGTEVFDGVKLNHKKFNTYQEAENYLFEKYCSSCTCEISGNYYEIREISFCF